MGVEDSKLTAQGANNDPAAPDYGTRTYPNAVHDHWKAVPGNPNFAYAFSPEFDVPNPVAELQVYPLYLKWESTSKWVNPPIMPPAGTVPDLEPLSPGELITIESIAPYNTNSNALGDLLISPSIPATGVSDIPLYYSINTPPAGVLYALEFTLHSGSPDLQPSDSLYLIFSPPGDDPVTKLHAASLYLEEYLATTVAVPEPGTVGLVAMVLASVAFWRRCKSR